MKRFNSLVLIFVGIVLLLLGSYKTGFVNCNPSLSFDLNKLEKLDNIAPVVVIGSGPAGLTAAIYSSRLGFPTYLIHGSMPGGQLTQTSYIENWPGEKRIKGQDLMDKKQDQAKDLGVIFLNEKVESVDLSRWPYKIKTSEDLVLNALSIIISTGATPKSLSIKGEKEYWGKGVTTCAVCDAPFYKGKDVVVIGGGDSAAEEALQLAPYAKHIEILVRKDKMRASRAMQNNVANLSNISISYNKELKEIIGDTHHVTEIKIYDNKENNEVVKPISGVFLAIGHDPNTQLFKNQLKIDSMGYIELKGRSQRTSLPGVFAAGDVDDHTYRQAIIAAGEGSKAALDADFFLQGIGVNNDFVHKLNLFNVNKTPEAHVSQIETVGQFDDIVKRNRVVVADFYGNQCPPCRTMMPIFESVSKKFADKVLFVKVDTAKNDALVEKLKIIKIPCFVIFKDGEFIERKYGIIDKQIMTDWINSYI